MRLMTVTFLVVLSELLSVGCCEAFDGIRDWIYHIPQIRTHDVFYPHPHLRDLQFLAKRGKILVVTLVVSAGLVVLVSSAIIKGGKQKKQADATKTIDPVKLRACVIAAATAGKRWLMEERKQALSMALSAYASARGVHWESDVQEYSSSVTCNIGKDRVTVSISDDNSAVIVRAISGNMGASATADVEGNSLRSSVFSSRALEKEADI